MSGVFGELGPGEPGPAILAPSEDLQDETTKKQRTKSERNLPEKDLRILRTPNFKFKKSPKKNVNAGTVKQKPYHSC